MSQEAESGDSGGTIKSQNPFNQAGLSSLIIGISSLALTNPNHKSIVAFVTPFFSYGVVYLWQWIQLNQKHHKYCAAIDSQIETRRVENLQPETTEDQRQANKAEMNALRVLKESRVLKRYETN